jgi:hypothetical protein
MLFKAHRFYFVCCGRHHAHKKFHKKFKNGLTDTFSDLGFLAASIRKLPSLKTVLVPYIEITCCNILYKICSQQHTKWNPWTLINNWQQLLIKNKWVYIFKFVPQNWKWGCRRNERKLENNVDQRTLKFLFKKTHFKIILYKKILM